VRENLVKRYPSPEETSIEKGKEVESSLGNKWIEA